MMHLKLSLQQSNQNIAVNLKLTLLEMKQKILGQQTAIVISRHKKLKYYVCFNKAVKFNLHTCIRIYMCTYAWYTCIFLLNTHTQYALYCLPKCLKTLLVDVHVVLECRRLALAEPVDVKNGHQVVQFVVGGERQSFPDGALSTLAISDKAIDTVAVT